MDGNMPNKTRRAKLKQVKYAFKHIPIVLQGRNDYRTIDKLCPIGSETPPEFDNWFVEYMGLGSADVLNNKIDILFVSISEK